MFFIVLSIGSPLKNILGWYEMYDIICPAHPSQRAAIGPAGASGSHGQLGTEESYFWSVSWIKKKQTINKHAIFTKVFLGSVDFFF